MAIRCDVYNCMFNDGGWCSLDYIEIVNRVCQEFEEIDRMRVDER